MKISLCQLHEKRDDNNLQVPNGVAMAIKVIMLIAMLWFILFPYACEKILVSGAYAEVHKYTTLEGNRGIVRWFANADSMNTVIDGDTVTMVQNVSRYSLTRVYGDVRVSEMIDIFPPDTSFVLEKITNNTWFWVQAYNGLYSPPTDTIILYTRPRPVSWPLKYNMADIYYGWGHNDQIAITTSLTRLAYEQGEGSFIDLGFPEDGQYMVTVYLSRKYSTVESEFEIMIGDEVRVIPILVGTFSGYHELFNLEKGVHTVSLGSVLNTSHLHHEVKFEKVGPYIEPEEPPEPVAPEAVRGFMFEDLGE